MCSIPQSGIYIIVNIKNGKVYIGQTLNIKKRWGDHKSSLNRNKHKNPHLQAAWNKYGEKAFKFQVLEYCSTERLDEREKHFIALYKNRGIAYNFSSGGINGLQGHVHGEQTRIKIANSKRGKPLSEEHKQKLSIALKGKHVSDETKIKMSLSKKGNTHHTEEAKKKMSVAHKNREPMSAEIYAKIAASNKGKTRTEETKKKMSDAKKGHIVSPETRLKLSAAQQGKTLSPETRQKISEANKGKPKRKRLDNE